MEISWRTEMTTATDTIDTIADGIAVRVPIEEALIDIRPVVDDILLVDDTAIIEAMKLAHRKLGLVVEPAGAAGLAAILTNRSLFSGQQVATVLCGGNVTDEQIGSWLC